MCVCICMHTHSHTDTHTQTHRYPYIQPAVREVCKKHGVRYAYYPTFFSNWFSTIKYIQDAGSGKIAPATISKPKKA